MRYHGNVQFPYSMILQPVLEVQHLIRLQFSLIVMSTVSRCNYRTYDSKLSTRHDETRPGNRY
jgi:hypothetical protein